MRVLIADDHEVVRQGLKQLLTEDFGPVTFGEATNTAEVLQQVQAVEWDLLILDINMPGPSGLEALAEVKRQRAALPVLILSMFSEAEYLVQAIREGAAGYISKQSIASELREAVKKVLDGGRYLTPALAEVLATEFGKKGAEWPHARLSSRESEVMRLLAAGKEVKEIARELSLSEKTVFTYRTRLLAKLGLHSNVEIARYALRHRLVE